MPRPSTFACSQPMKRCQGEWRPMPAPASIGILAVAQPAGRAVQRTLVRGSVCSPACRQAKQDMARIEDDSHARRGIDLPALETAIVELDSQAPVEHAVRAHAAPRRPCATQAVQASMTAMVSEGGISG
ncbi:MULTISPECIES: hypothetical protein [unclassified Janthinobacterium]|uniref:hypothetical protein n=1 Tax=unclassified Janthinobacterium TaxID=2610881 RepID=UPI00161FAE3B|nr:MULTISPECIES: hypothetical protein [unclassified Janthinobacterium]MBB5368588.1 hypothetical protein [Janthinobacterium sp. K2C7]MBB5381876.1 hypothetical protein [Janthinobacterium sp. K2Li3]MBB5386970.1 hypothetical protein [Janthinobacterium sp. K2E3]